MKQLTALFALFLSINLSAQSFETYAVHLDHPNQHLAPCLDGYTLFFDYNMTNYALPLVPGGTVDLPIASDIAPPTTSNMRVNNHPLSYIPRQWNNDDPITICCECSVYDVYFFVDSVMKTVWISMIRNPDLACSGPGCDDPVE